MKLQNPFLLCIFLAIAIYCHKKDPTNDSTQQPSQEEYKLIVERGAFHYDRFELTPNKIEYHPDPDNQFENEKYNTHSETALDSIIISSFFQEIEERGFWDLKQHYEAYASCSSELRITLIANEKTKTVICDDYSTYCHELIKYIEKKVVLFAILTLLLTSCNLNKPLDYYNMAVSAGNTSLTFHEMERRLERLESGMNLDPIDITERVEMRIPYNEKLLEDLEGLLGNEESDSMIKAAVAYLTFDIECSKNLKTTEVFEIVGNAKNFEEVSTKLEPLGNYLDRIYDEKEELWTTYDFEVTSYAKKNDIEMKFY